jgi:hypothetical protein
MRTRIEMRRRATTQDWIWNCLRTSVHRIRGRDNLFKRNEGEVILIKDSPLTW